MAGYGQPLILDWSAYARVLVANQKGPGDGRLTAAQLQEFNQAVLDGDLHVCPPFRLEARYSAQGDAEFAQIERTLNGFEQADSDDRTFAVALTAQQDLAQATGISHRVKPVDLMIAALGHQHGLGVLHYDKDYEALSSRSSLVFTSRWIAPKGSVD